MFSDHKKLRMKDNTVDKKSAVEKRTKWVIEQMLSDHKKLRNERKKFHKKSQNLIYFNFLKTVMSSIA